MNFWKKVIRFIIEVIEALFRKITGDLEWEGV